MRLFKRFERYDTKIRKMIIEMNYNDSQNQNTFVSYLLQVHLYLIMKSLILFQDHSNIQSIDGIYPF